MAPQLSEDILVEQELVKHLVHLGWTHVQGHKTRPEVTGREEFREVLLLDRLRAALRRINVTDDGEVWLDEGRIAQAVGALTRPGTLGLMESNRAATEVLLGGTTVDGDPDLHGGRDATVRFIDFEHPERNDFLVVNQFRVDLPGSSAAPRYIVPDLVLFVNGVPLGGETARRRCLHRLCAAVACLPSVACGRRAA